MWFRKLLRWTGGKFAVGILRLIRLLNPDRAANLGAFVLRTFGPWSGQQRIGRENLRLAYPEKSPEEIEKILRGVWDNLGRTVFEYAQMDRIWGPDPANPQRVEYSQETADLFVRLRDDGKPALIFAAHLANWELPAIAAAANGLEIAVLFRPPNFAEIAEAVESVRAVNMGALVPSRFDAGIKLAGALERGVHVGALVDQRLSRGVRATFFGRPCTANPTLARLATRYDCPIHGVRAIRLPGNRFRVELTEAIPPVRNSDGNVDVAETMQKITSVVESWVREYPEQWLWFHRRWRI